MNTMQITCDCEEISPKLPFQRDKSVAWQCPMCGRRHLFYLQKDIKKNKDFDWWQEAKAFIPSADCLVYAPFMDGVLMNCFDVAKWRKQATYKKPRGCKVPDDDYYWKPLVKPLVAKLFVKHDEHWKAMRENRRRLFLRKAEVDGLGLSLASYDFKNRLIQKLTLQDEIKDLFAESSRLRGVRDAAAKEIRRYQRQQKL